MNPATVCGYEIGKDFPLPAPGNLPPNGSGPVVWQIIPCFPKQENKPLIDAQTYAFYIQLPRSEPSKRLWTPFDDTAVQTIQGDFKRLWATTFLDDLSIEAVDYTFPNGVIGKLVVYNMEERQRVKIVDYTGNDHLEATKIDEKLKEESVTIRLDSFLDQSVVQKVRGIVKDLLAEKGYQFAEVTPEVKPTGQGPKLVHLTFNIHEGPKIKIRQITFVGNKAISSRALRRQMKNNKAQTLLSVVTRGGNYLQAKYEEDADRITEYYRNRGFISARIGEPELKVIEDARDKKTRYIDMRIPVSEGNQYRMASLSFDGAKMLKEAPLRAMFKVAPGDVYSEKTFRKGLEKAKEVYGSIGYWEFTGFPDLKPEGAEDLDEQGNPKPAAEAPAREAPAADKQAPAPDKAKGAQAPGKAPAAKAPGRRWSWNPVSWFRPDRTPVNAPKVDVILRIQEGKQYFVNRITFTGNTSTRDNVVRRELRLYEGGVFNFEALKYSVKRINQLGYFKQMEGGKDLQIDKTPNADNKVDVTLKVEEQNRNQVTFGAGVSQFEGFFGQLGFQTSNFMGRGETFSVSLQAGSRAQIYQVGFSEPFLFDRNLTGGINIYKRRLQYLYQFTESSVGGDITFGLPLADRTRAFINYSYQHSKVLDVNPVFLDPAVLASNPYLQEQLLIGMNGSRRVSKITPSLMKNTVDQPIFPTDGTRLTASLDLAGIGGDTNFFKPLLEGVFYVPHIKGSGGAPARTSLGIRAQFQYLSPFTGSADHLPIFEKLVMGGEYSVRGFDIRSIGPRAVDPADPSKTGYLVLGGNKSFLLNVEYLIGIAGPVRLVLFADAGQVRDVGQRFAMNEFKTSTGAEIRFFMPVLNVPFRLIFAYNPNRRDVYDNSFNLQKAFSFRFAVGSTF
jgi:outer membrane protein insertion porin family